MTKQLRNRWIDVVAFAAAFLVALQVSFASYAMAAGAGTTMVDAFGNPLCISHMEEQMSDTAPGKERTLLPECCTLACAMAIGFTPSDRAVSIFFNPLAQPSDRIADTHADVVRPARNNLLGYPRAPSQAT